MSKMRIWQPFYAKNGTGQRARKPLAEVEDIQSRIQDNSPETLPEFSAFDINGLTLVHDAQEVIITYTATGVPYIGFRGNIIVLYDDAEDLKSCILSAYSKQLIQRPANGWGERSG